MSEDPSRRVLDLVESLLDSRPIETEITPQRIPGTDDERRIEAIRQLALIARASRELDEPPRWGHFELLESLGAGSSGEVYRARDTRLNREVALKLYHQTFLEGSAERILKEGQRHSQVKHPNIVTIYSAEEHDGRVGISMELIRGRTLQELAKLGGFAPFSGAEAGLIGLELCRSLAAVHENRLTHGDVKASNVMRETGGRIVLMDFSASRPVKEGVRSGEVVAGTPLYMAPEVLSGGRPNERSDLYSIGVLLFYLVTGTYPVTGASLAALQDAYARGERRSLREAKQGLPEDFVRAVELCLELDPAKRIESAASLAELLTSGKSDDGFTRLVAVLAKAAKLLGQAAASVGASARLLGRVGLYGTAVAGILAALGFLTTMTHNVALGLDEFGFASSSSFLDYVRWGARTLILPSFFAVTGVLVYCLAAVGARWSWRIPGRMRELCGQAIDRVLSPFSSSPKALAQTFVLFAFASFAFVYSQFSDFIDAFMGISGKEPEKSSGFAVLSPACETHHDNYYMAFTLLSLVLAFSLGRVLRRLKGEPTLSAIVVLGAGTSIALSFALLATPYRLLTHNESERVQFEGRPAYAVGRKSSELLLFIPMAGIPEKRVVGDDDPRLQRDPESAFENVLTLYADDSCSD